MLGVLWVADGTVKAVKWYPAGATTNSGGGVKETDLPIVLPTLQAMAEVPFYLYR